MEYRAELNLVDEDGARFTTLGRPDDAGGFKLIHDFAGAVEADRIAALKRRCRRHARSDNRFGDLFKQRVAVGERT